MNIQIRRAQSFWKSIQAARDAAIVVKMSDSTNRNSAAEKASQILKKNCSAEFLPEAISEFELALRQGNCVSAEEDKEGVLRLTIILEQIKEHSRS